MTDIFTAPRGFLSAPRSAEIGGARAVILGIPFDCGTHPRRIGARQGPAAIRDESQLISPFHCETGIDPAAALGLVDLGDLALTSSDIAGSFAAIEAAITAITQAHAVPVTLGGDGAVALPEMRALSRAHPGLVAVHIDAHTDAYPIPGINTATPFAIAAQEGVIDTAHSFQIGMRGSNLVPGVIAHGRALGFNVITQRELLARGIEAVFADIRARIGDRPVYLSFDMDVFDPAVAPGVCSPTWGGLSAREGLAALECCFGLNLVGININTVSPPHDVGGMTALLAATVAYDALHMLARMQQTRPDR